ncbi:hypothetical protein KDW10_27975 [Burkholderia vietnamiensis]|uniref:hypothetical protein n=1 Tax=Burkholderia vietnamiensis TaxID=60552 RepID=UPI001BA1FF92|nr:hypothetical protein [Burkholderia vietnamiensis]MBR8361171.1 hypothetical protein [Burkholderia vietnamiensis]
MTFPFRRLVRCWPSRGSSMESAHAPQCCHDRAAPLPRIRSFDARLFVHGGCSNAGSTRLERRPSDSSDPSIRPALKPKTDHLSTHIVSNFKVITGASQCSGAEPVDTLTRYRRRRERADCRYAAG